MHDMVLYQNGDRERIKPIKDKDNDHRDPFRRDLARVVHSAAFRRLQRKTQLFPSDENDFYRNRLTHSIEVAQIATAIALNLNNNEPALKEGKGKDRRIQDPIVNLAALAHDIGHPPFGHKGELALNGLMNGYGGFEGNAQTLRVLSRIEKKETSIFPPGELTLFGQHCVDLRLGLNLTMRSLAAVLKYDHQIPETHDGRLEKGYFDTEQALVKKIKACVAPGTLERNSRPLSVV